MIGDGLASGGDDRDKERGAESTAEDDMLDSAFEALRDDDQEGFRDAMRGAIRACLASYDEAEG